MYKEALLKPLAVFLNLDIAWQLEESCYMIFSVLHMDTELHCNEHVSTIDHSDCCRCNQKVSQKNQNLVFPHSNKFTQQYVFVEFFNIQPMEYTIS